MHETAIRDGDIPLTKGVRSKRSPPFSSVSSMKLKRSAGKSKVQ